MSSATCRFGGDGIAGLLWQLVGAVAIGELANAGVVVANGVSAIAFGGSCGPPACVGDISACSVDVGLSVVVVCLLGGWKTIGGCSCACGVGGGVIVCPVWLMMSNICLSYFSGLGMRLIVLALMTLLLMPRSVSPVAVSLPSQIALKKRCSIFGSCLTVGSRYCIVSPNSQIGALWSLFHLRK